MGVQWDQIQSILGSGQMDLETAIDFLRKIIDELQQTQTELRHAQHDNRFLKKRIEELEAENTKLNEQADMVRPRLGDRRI